MTIELKEAVHTLLEQYMVEMLTTSLGLADVEKGGKLIVINKI